MAKRPPGLIYDERDIDAVVRTMLGEAAGEGEEGLAAVAHVAVNRYERGGYGGTLYDVVHAPKQFSAWNDESVGGNSLVKLSKDDPRYQKARAIAEEVLNGRRADNTGGAVNYFAPKGMTGKNGTVKGEPKWASQMSYTTTIGGHKFYSDDSAAGAAERMASGKGVSGIQQQLAQRGFDPGPIDGIKGPRTTAAIKEFQRANGLVADGIVGPKTMAALNGSQSRPTTQRQGAPAVPGSLLDFNNMPPRASFWQETGKPPSTLTQYTAANTRAEQRTLGGRSQGAVLGAKPSREADSGVAQLQQQLQQRGFSPGPIDGIAGPQTQAAVKEFQRANGLQVDGIVGPRTLAALQGRDEFKPLPAPAPLVAPDYVTAYAPTPKTTPTVSDAWSSGWQQMASAPVVQAASAAPASGGGGFDLGGMLRLGTSLIPGGGLGGQILTAVGNTKQGQQLGRTLGTRAETAGKTLGGTVTQAGTAIGANAPAVIEKAAMQSVGELMKTPGGRGLLLNTALGITPAKRPEQRVAERNMSAPEGYGYGSTGKKLYKIGQVYNSSRGQVVFNGTGFVPAGTQVRTQVDVPARSGTSRRAAQQADFARRGVNEFGMLSDN